ncbi:hypothetical protein LTR62_006744 [Meristemomyces frigidus]|uniref:Uncharacterized protein n=1 Tax=Meristemomyces frigidus TaxID=1508187 RepID=A0AAN7TNT7_9PEZI|nr:hypothetical protein LTR62_006744 [Meristemomyces frigidus]
MEGQPGQEAIALRTIDKRPAIEAQALDEKHHGFSEGLNPGTGDTGKVDDRGAMHRTASSTSQLPMSKARTIALVVTLTGAAFLNTMSVQAAVIALPTIGRDLHIPAARQQWILYLHFMFALTEGKVVGWGRPYIGVVIATSIILIIAFVFWQLRLEKRTICQPLIKMTMFKNLRVAAAMVTMAVPKEDQSLGGAAINAVGQTGTAAGPAIATAIQVAVQEKYRDEASSAAAGKGNFGNTAFKAGLRVENWISAGLGVLAFYHSDTGFQGFWRDGAPKR